MERRTSDVALWGLSALLLAACGVAKAQRQIRTGPLARRLRRPRASPTAPARRPVNSSSNSSGIPPNRSTAADRSGGLFLLDIATGRVTLIADEPDPGDSYCGSPAWSNDGRRILFDAMKADDAGRAHLKVLEVGEGRLTMTDLGIGNCPTFSPDDRRIAFLYNPAPNRGVWVMHADGSERQPLGSYGRPRWSLDGHQMMITGFSIPYRVTIMDVDPEKSGRTRHPRQPDLLGAELGGRPDPHRGHRIQRHHRTDRHLQAVAGQGPGDPVEEGEGTRGHPVLSDLFACGS